MKRVIILLAALALSSTAVAQQSTRNQMWDFGVLIGNLSGESIEGADDSSLETSSAAIYGFNFAYNFNSHFALGGELSWSRPDYDAVIIPDDGVGDPQTIRHQLDLFSYGLTGTFNLLKGPLTPYAELGLGWTNMDSNVADQPPITGCWWDPWWGYVCSTFWSTYSKTRETYSGALGVRWDLDNGMSLKGSYGVRQIDIGKATSDAKMDYYRVDLAWRF